MEQCVFSSLTLLLERQEGHQECRKQGNIVTFDPTRPDQFKIPNRRPDSNCSV